MNCHWSESFSPQIEPLEDKGEFLEESSQMVSSSRIAGSGPVGCRGAGSRWTRRECGVKRSPVSARPKGFSSSWVISWHATGRFC